MDDSFAFHHQKAKAGGIAKSADLAMEIIKARGAVWIHKDGRGLVNNGAVMKALPKQVFDTLIKRDLIIKDTVGYSKEVDIYIPSKRSK